MRVNFQSPNPALQANLINNPTTSFMSLVNNIRNNNPTSWEERSTVVQERGYHQATLKSDKMTAKTAEIIFDSILNDELAKDLFIHALTGDYRNPEFMRGAERIKKTTDALITEVEKVAEQRANTPQENAELVDELNRRLGYNILEQVSEKSREYLLSRLPDGYGKDSREPMKDERIKW